MMVTVTPGETVDLVLPGEWAMSFSGQIRLHEASDEERDRMEAWLKSTAKGGPDRG